jgi:hypothetical protein
VASGVRVHIHDIFLPFDYPPAWRTQLRQYTEQWLLAAMLADTTRWQVEWASQYVVREHGDWVRAVIPQAHGFEESDSYASSWVMLRK